MHLIIHLGLFGKGCLFAHIASLQVLKNFQFWDYNAPEDLPHELRNSFKVLIADPPYLVRV